jgi:4-hydroxyacetophenone monooxygenase
MGSVSKAPKTPASRYTEGYDVDEIFIRKGLQEVDSNPLRIALYQITGDAELASMTVQRKEFIGGGFIDYVISDTDATIVREKALNYFFQSKKNISPPLSKEEAFKLMDLFSDVPINSPKRAVGVDYEEGYEQLAFEDYPRDVKWTNDVPHSTAKDWKIAIIGAGVSGIAAAISLQRLGIPFDIIERQSGIGGTWRLNRYPKCTRRQSGISLPVHIHEKVHLERVLPHRWRNSAVPRVRSGPVQHQRKVQIQHRSRQRAMG